VAIDLNNFVNPASGWVLNYAWDIDDNNWVTGVGMFDSDGAGPLAAYQRDFLMQVPEPGSLSVVMMSLLALTMKRRRK
jgi:hypothetical protein